MHTDKELRMECLRLATRHTTGGRDFDVTLAEAYYRFVMNFDQSDCEQPEAPQRKC